VIDYLKKLFNLQRDNNYYLGLFLLKIGVVTIFLYLFFDAFEPVSFLITFAICGWGFVLLWKSDNDYRFQLVQQKVVQLETELERKNVMAEITRTVPRRRRKLRLSRRFF
jgi:hypothetical protein